MAAGEALLFAALHQASTMALLTCFCPAPHQNTSDTMQSQPTQSASQQD